MVEERKFRKFPASLLCGVPEDIMHSEDMLSEVESGAFNTWNQEKADYYYRKPSKLMQWPEGGAPGSLGTQGWREAGSPG
jgi:hypothetical protein